MSTPRYVPAEEAVAVVRSGDRVFVHDRQQAKQYSNVLPGTPNVKEEHGAGWWKDPERRGRYPDLGELPVKAGATYAARWDVAHAQAIIAVRSAASTGANRPDYWLVRYRPEVDR